ncbi:hypothetical protein OSB04_032167 [Centaurea solstitialis]|uniref:Zinc finger, CCHC-type n=1 Tax=Centaurea solstitialis TaxID=347529 RepID=A0AA38W6S6_9ASTR|nr:hypothetical protein OSB04_032167 [Centaurea solstitialis]
MAELSSKDMTTKFTKLEKFQGIDFRRWQKKMHFLLTTLNVVHVLSSTAPEEKEDETPADIRKRCKWDNDDYVCRGHILNGMTDPLFDIYQNVENAKQLWNDLESKYIAEDASSKKFLVSDFNNYKMVDSSHVWIETSFRDQESDKEKVKSDVDKYLFTWLGKNNFFMMFCLFLGLLNISELIGKGIHGFHVLLISWCRENLATRSEKLATQVTPLSNFNNSRTDQLQVDEAESLMTSKFVMKDLGEVDVILEGYSDASWITHVKEDHSSTTGWVFLLGGGAISWASKKQTCITNSTMESEFVALAAAGKEAEWLRNLIYEIPLWSKPIAPISIHCDSAATLAKAYSQVYNGKSRHLGVRHSMIRDLIMNGVISVEFVKSQQNMADHLTKSLARDLVHKSVIGMGLRHSNGLKGSTLRTP